MRPDSNEVRPDDEAAVPLDALFAALAHPTRRAALDALAAGAQTVSELARPHGLSLTGFLKHVRILEEAGLIVCSKEGRSVTCALKPRPRREAAARFADREQVWSDRFDALARHLYHAEQTAPRKKVAGRPAGKTKGSG